MYRFAVFSLALCHSGCLSDPRIRLSVDTGSDGWPKGTLEVGERACSIWLSFANGQTFAEPCEAQKLGDDEWRLQFPHLPGGMGRERMYLRSYSDGTWRLQARSDLPTWWVEH